jgi:hypothetical protein
MTQLNPDVASVILEYANYFENAVLFEILFPGSKRKCYNRNLVETTYTEGNHCSYYNNYNNYYKNTYTLFGMFHRENDLPAIIHFNGKKEWYCCNELHRSNDKPAVIWNDGTCEWFVHNMRHRDNDQPAIEDLKGYKQWFFKGFVHRLEGPAILHRNGNKSWYRYGLFIRSEQAIP